MNEQEKYERAKERVHKLRGFYSHLIAYVGVNMMTILINVLMSPGVWWFVWPLFGWGLGVVMHAVGVFGVPGLFGREWEERKIREYMDRP